MIIELPKEFSFRDERKGKEAFIEDGVLKITRQVNFGRLMIEISYQMKGEEKCYYCNKKITKEQVTIDHKFPINFGGPTITNNLFPACKSCNRKKENMTYYQYMALLEAEESGLKGKYLRALRQYQGSIKSDQQYQIPKDWITEKEITDIITCVTLDENYKGKRYHSLERYYLKYNKIKKPIVLDRNSFLLDGFLVLMLAKNYKINKLAVIELENVEVII